MMNLSASMDLKDLTDNVLAKADNGIEFILSSG